MVIDHTNLYYSFTVNLIDYIKHTYIAYIAYIYNMQYNIIKKKKSKSILREKSMPFN